MATKSNTRKGSVGKRRTRTARTRKTLTGGTELKPVKPIGNNGGKSWKNREVPSAGPLHPVSKLYKSPFLSLANSPNQPNITLQQINTTTGKITNAEFMAGLVYGKTSSHPNNKNRRVAQGANPNSKPYQIFNPNTPVNNLAALGLSADPKYTSTGLPMGGIHTTF